VPVGWKLQISRPELAELGEMVDDGYPNETCGLLLGMQLDTRVEVQSVRQARNLNTVRAHDRFELDPLDMLSAESEARATGLEIIGIWHSHPDHPARPSEADRRAAWKGWSYMILSVEKHGVVDVRSWRLTEELQFIEEELEQ